MIATRTKAEARTKKQKGNEGIFSSIWTFSLGNSQWRRIQPFPGISNWYASLFKSLWNYCMIWHQSLWTLPTIRHTLFWILAAHGQLDRERQSKGSRNMRCIVALRQNIAFAISPLCCQLWGRNLFGKLYYSFSDNTSVFYQSWSAWDERRAFLILPFSDEEFGYDYWTVSKRRQNYMSNSSPAEYSTMGQLVLDLTSLAYQPKSRERFARLKKHVTFSLSNQNSAKSLTRTGRKGRWYTSCSSRPYCRFWRRRWSASGATCIKEWTSDRKAWICRGTQSACTVTKKKRISSLARPIYYTGARCVRKLARAIRRSLDFGQQSRRWSSPQHHK